MRKKNKFECRVLYVVSFIGEQGPNNQLAYLISNLPNAVLPYVYVLGGRLDNGNTAIIEKKAEVVYGNMWGIVSLFGIIKINSMIRKYKIGVIQSFGFRCDIISSLVQTRARKIVVVRNITVVNWKQLSIFGGLLSKLHIHLFRKFDLVVSCSDAVAQHLQDFGIETVVINNSISHIPSTKAQPCTFNKFLTVSSKIPGKNIEFLLKSFRKHPVLKSCTITVVGHIEPKLFREYSNDENIVLLGYVNKIRDVLDVNDGFISASIHEGLPNAVLESLSCYRAVILSDILAHRSIIRSYDDVGSVFKNNCADSLVRSLEVQQNKLGLLSRMKFDEFLKKRYSPESMSQKYSSLYCETFVDRDY